MKIHVNFPVSDGRVVLRTEHDWDKDVEPVEASATVATFVVDLVRPTLALKPCLRRGTEFLWARGANYVLNAHEPFPSLFPYFEGSDHGRVSAALPFDVHGVTRSIRVYTPPGYAENPLRRYPVVYMADGKNLFFPDEAFAGHEWRVDETMDRLDQMNAIRKAIVVGIHTADRMRDYTKPGYEAYGRFVVEHLKPYVDAHFRTRPGPHDSVVMGSSLGGVVSLYLAWQHPDVFGRAACLSSTFGVFDDLFDRIAHEPRRDILLYLDSGWPRDNYDATNAMRDLLVVRGYRLGVDLLQFSAPEGLHTEASWAARLHIPFQFFFGRAWLAQRGERW
ncbi:MAG: alpha/beta hydrolase [Deltaproteobacteria bacterium]|nr:alpha/beta hydrolase [Deltaproteobacteria bacterium]